jgi:hypothetical protein
MSAEDGPPALDGDQMLAETSDLEQATLAEKNLQTASSHAVPSDNQEVAKEKDILAGLLVKSVTQGALEKKIIETAEAQAAKALAEEDAEREAALARARCAVEAVKKKMALPAFSSSRQQELLKKQLAELQDKLDKLDNLSVEMQNVNVSWCLSSRNLSKIPSSMP